jgi:tRNA (guanosine-2'-O-)-methyltransferase
MVAAPAPDPADAHGQDPACDPLERWLSEHPLSRFVTDRRQERMLEILRQRLTSVTVVSENLYDSHNVSAVVRTAEGFGLDTFHVVELPNKYKRNAAILRGADRWVTIRRHRKLNTCLLNLEAAGFTLAAADVGPGCVPLGELPVDRPIAIVLGSERDGLSPRAKGMINTRFTIPMQGFTDSFNVSVSAAIALYDLTKRRRALLAEQGIEGELSDGTIKKHLHAWLKKCVRDADKILELGPPVSF